MSRHEPPETANLDSEPLDKHAVDRYEADNSSAIAVRSIDDIKRLSSMFIESGMFKTDSGTNQLKQLSQACVKIVAGIEFGIQPFASMRGINIINGNAEMSSNLMAAKVKKHPKYDYRVVTSSNDECTLEFFEFIAGKSVSLGKSTWTIDDAKRAGLTRNPTWQKFPMNMCFARALSNGVRIYTPDVFYGAPVYVEGEISGEFEAQPQDEPAETPTAKQTAPREAIEGEVVIGDEPTEAVAESDPLQDKLDEIQDLSREMGKGDDWFTHVSGLIKTYEDAEQVYGQLRQKQIEQVMNDE